MVLCLLVSIAAPSKTEAGACPSGGHLSVSTGSSVVPTNVQLRVTLNVRNDQIVSVHDFAGNTGLASSAILNDTRVTADEAVFAIREKGGAIVSVTSHRLPSTTLPTFLLIPKSPLEPDKRYAVFLRHEKQEYRFHYFNTASAADTTPPKLEGVRKIRFRSKVTSGGKGDTYGPSAELWLKGLSDREGSPLAIEIHDLTDTLDADASTLRTTQWASVQKAGGDSVRFGKTAGCTQSNFAFQAGTIRALPGRRVDTRMRIGIRAIDLAGNLSPMHVVRLKLK